jgi:hypothetical protein
MRSRFRSTLLAIVATTVVAGACGSDSSTGPSVPAIKADLGKAFDELGLSTLTDAGGMTGLFIPPAVFTGCTYTAAVQSFVCPTENDGGLSFAFSYALMDASGAVQPAFSPTTTNSVRTASLLHGTLSEDGTTLSIDGRQDMTLSGLLTAKHTLNGTSDFHVVGSFSTGVETFSVASRTKTTFTNLVLPGSETGASKWPASGTILSEETEDGATAAEKILLTFNGTSTMAMVITGTDGAVSHCTMDLARSAIAVCHDGPLGHRAGPVAIKRFSGGAFTLY